MTSREQIEQILNKIEKKKQTSEDIDVLRQSLLASNHQTAIQLGKYNVNIEQGKDIHIGDRKYYSWDEKALKALINLIQFGEVDEGNLLVIKLNNARLKGEEGDRHTGSFYTYNVCLEDVCLEKSHDVTENNYHIQQYTIKGKWSSEVYKEINVFGLRVDRPWGSRKKPYGNFNVKVEFVNGKLAHNKIDVNRYDDSSNNYAANKAKQLIHSKIRNLSSF